MFQKMEIFSSMRKYLIPIDINGERQSRQISSPGIISTLAVGIKKFWTEDSKNNNLFKGYKDQLDVPENCEYVEVPLLNDSILKNKTYRND